MSILYLIFIALAAYYSFRYDGIEVYDSHKQHRLWLLCAYLICLTGFSYGLGADKFTYMGDFEIYPKDFSETSDFIWLQLMQKGMMPLWTIVNLLCKVFFDSFYAVQFLESAAINIAVCYVMSRHTHRYFLFLIIFFVTLQYFIFNTEIMREGFALAFAIVGMDGYVRGRKWLFWLLLPFGILFHIAAAIVVLFPFVRFRVSWTTLFVAVGLAFGMWLFSDLVFTKVVTIVFGGQGELVKKIMFYSMQATSIFGFLRALFTYLVFPFIVMYTVTLAEQSEAARKRKEKLTSYMVVLAVLACSFAGFARLYNSTQIFYLILLTEFVYMLTRYSDYFIIRMGAFAGTLFLVVLSYFSYYETTDTYFYDYFYPYTSIIDESDDVFIREVAHYEAVTIEVEDNNVRNIE